jgi:D-glycero-D-manno-heptose 1,7-bisphosphate phosphatase
LNFTNPLFRPALCLDMDGTVRYAKSGGFIKGCDDIALFDGIEDRILAYKDRGFLIYGVSNQGGIAHGHRTSEQVKKEFAATLALFSQPHPFERIVYCPSDPRGNVEPYCYRSLMRKPDYGLLVIVVYQKFEEDGTVIDWLNSLFVGDREEDQQCAANAGIPFQWAEDFRAGAEVVKA